MIKSQEPKDWYKNQVKRWSIRTGNQILEYYTFDHAYITALIFDCVNTIQYKIL